MAKYTGNYTLYQWSENDTKLETIQESAKNAQKVDDALSTLKGQLSLKDLGSVPRTIGVSSSEKSLNLKDFGAKGDGSDASLAFIAMFAMGQTRGIYEFYVPDGRFGITQTISMPRKARLHLGRNAVIYPRANVDIVKMAPDAMWQGGYIDLKSHSLVPDWDKNVFYFDASDMYQLYEQRHEVCDVNIQGTPKTGGWKGTAFKLEAKLPDTYINNVQFNRIMITNIGTGFHFRVDPSITDVNHPSWVNACDGAQIGMQNFEYGFKYEGLNNVPRDVGGNKFRGLQLQAEIGTKHMIYCESSLNTWDGFFWDLHKMVDTNQAFYFTNGSRFNEVTSAMASELTESWYDKGYLNSFPSPNSYTADKRVNAMPISTPGYPNFLGDQDDWLIYGDTRVGMTVTNTTPASPSIPITNGATLTDILLPDTENGIEFDMTNSEYIHPAVIEIDLTNDPCWYASYVTAIFSWERVPKGLRIEVWDTSIAAADKWVWFHEIKENTSQNVIVSPPYSMGNTITKIKISMFGYNPTRQDPNNKKVMLSRVMMTSQKDIGKAFLPGNYKPTILPPDMPPSYPGETQPNPNEGRINGDQEDILLMADKRFTVTQTAGAAKTSGNIFDMFRRASGGFCRWNNPPVGTPIVLEIDFGPNGIDYMESFGITFSEAESAKNVKFERQTTLGTWSQFYNLTNNTSGQVHRVAKANKTYKIRVTFSVPNNTSTNYVRINRIFATSQSDIPKGFLGTDTGGITYGDVEFGDVVKGVIMKTPDGTKRFRLTIDNAGQIVSTLI